MLSDLAYFQCSDELTLAEQPSSKSAGGAQAPQSDAMLALERTMRAAVIIQRHFRVWRRRRARAQAFASAGHPTWCAACRSAAYSMRLCWSAPCLFCGLHQT